MDADADLKAAMQKAYTADDNFWIKKIDYCMKQHTGNFNNLIYKWEFEDFFLVPPGWSCLIASVYIPTPHIK